MNFNYKKTTTSLKKVIIPSLVMIIPIVIAKHFITFEYTRFNSFISLLVFGIYGVISYLLVSYKNNSLYDVFGEEFVNKILSKLHLKKNIEK